MRGGVSELVLAYLGWRRASATTASAPTTQMPVMNTQGTHTQSNKRTLVQKTEQQELLGKVCASVGSSLFLPYRRLKQHD